MRDRTGRAVRGGLLAVLLAVVAGCGGAEKPVDPAPVTDTRRPMPAGTEIDPDLDLGSDGPDCDPTASLPPNRNISAASSMAEIKERGHLTVGVDQNTFLFGFSDPETGKLEGFDIDIAKEIARALFDDPEAVRFKAISSADREDALKPKKGASKHGEGVLGDGKVDVVVRTFSITCERLKNINFSTVYYVAGQKVLVNADSTATGLEDLGGQRVCATWDSTSLYEIAKSRPRPVPVAVKDWSDCLALLQQGQVEAVSTDDTILAGMHAQDPEGTKVVGERFTEEYYGIGIPKENEDMVRYVNSVLEDVRKGPWQESYDTWLKPYFGAASPPTAKYR